MRQKIFSTRTGLALLGGVLLALAFPKAGVAGFAWIAPCVVLCAALGTTGKRAFGLGYLSGAVFFLTTLYFLLFIPFPAGAIAGWLALSLYCALYLAVWVWLSCRWFPASSPDRNFRETLESFKQIGWLKRQWWVLQVSLLWIALEILRSHLLTGFPFNLLGVSQLKILPLIQIASVTGVYGVSFVVIFFSVSLISVIATIANRQAVQWSWAKEIVPATIIVIGTVWFGFGKLSMTPQTGASTIKVALIQPDIPQRLVWQADESVYEERFEKVMQLSREALASGPDLLILPESALPPLDGQQYQTITNLVSENNVWLIFGYDDRGPAPDDPTRDRHYNASFLMDPEGQIANVYRKQRLVIFGEYVPLMDTLPFLKFLTPIEGGFSAGEVAVQFTLTDLEVTTSVLICFEDVFPHSVRHHVQNGTDFLVNITNDGWFGESAAQWQHAHNAAFRAIENGVPLIRATNNGITCWIDARGRIHEAAYSDGRTEYEAGFKIVHVPIVPGREQTFFNKHGNWFGWTCAGLAALQTLASFAFRRKQKAWPDETPRFAKKR